MNLKLEHIVAYGNSSDELDIGIVLQGQGHSAAMKLFSVYHNTNCQVLYLSLGTC